MSIAWPDLAAALGLLLVAEGILPFLTPAGARSAFRRLAEADDATLRAAGAVSMVAGVAIVWLVRA